MGEATVQLKGWSDGVLTGETADDMSDVVQDDSVLLQFFVPTVGLSVRHLMVSVHPDTNLFSMHVGHLLVFERCLFGSANMAWVSSPSSLPRLLSPCSNHIVAGVSDPE